MEPAEALERIAELLVRGREPRYKAEAFRRAARTVRGVEDAELRRLAAAGRLGDLPGVGSSSATVIAQALEGRTPDYLEGLLGSVPDPGTPGGNRLRAALRGDLHLHSDWSDGGGTIRAMAEEASGLGHEYLALTDHSPRLTVAHGLSPERLEEQLEEVATLNAELPLRILTGMEVDILDDGRLDLPDELLGRLDVVVASAHSKLRMEPQAMTDRLVAAVANPHTDVLGHCTNRMLTGRGRPESTFDADLVFAACVHFDKAVEVNCRPERLDPPRRLLRRAVELGAKVAIDTDAHAPDQLHWHPYGCDRAAECGVPVDSIVNTWPVERLLAWTASHAA